MRVFIYTLLAAIPVILLTSPSQAQLASVADGRFELQLGAGLMSAGDRVTVSGNSGDHQGAAVDVGFGYNFSSQIYLGARGIYGEPKNEDDSLGVSLVTKGVLGELRYTIIGSSLGSYVSARAGYYHTLSSGNGVPVSDQGIGYGGAYTLKLGFTERAPLYVELEFIKFPNDTGIEDYFGFRGGISFFLGGGWKEGESVY